MARRAAARKKKQATPSSTEQRPEEETAAENPMKLAAEVYREVGGFKRFAEWASDEKNIGVFYRDIFLKMLARSEASAGREEEVIVVRIENRAKE